MPEPPNRSAPLGAPDREREQHWADLLRTAAAVRAPRTPLEGDGQTGRRGRRVAMASIALLAAVTATHPDQETASADGGADATLFALTNQDRAANGVGAVRSNGLLSSIGENRPYRGCGAGTIRGRSQDMIDRNYFSHPIPPCGQYVFKMFDAAGLGYRAAGENIGWDSGISDPTASAAYINTSFMNSPEHRANILNGAYTDLGIGSVHTAGTWTGAGPQYQNVWMWSEEFAQTVAAPPPARAPTPPPAVTAAPVAPRNSPAPPAPSVPPVVVTPAPTPSPTPPGPASTPAGGGQPTGGIGSAAEAPVPLEAADRGLLPDAVEAVLATYLLG